MRTFAQKQKPPQQTKSADRRRSGLAFFGKSREVRSILHLQRTIGNHAVLRLLQARTQNLDEGLLSSASPRFAYDFSRISVYDNGCTKIQPKLTVSTPGDIYEQEADLVADQVMRMAEPPLQRDRARDGDYPQRSIEQSAQQEQQTKIPQSHNAEGVTVSPVLQQVISSPGQSLNLTTREFMESRFGYDFSRVRVHTDPLAAELACAANARAFTVGSDLVFGAGEYRPGELKGDRLLAHELTHVAQQTHPRQPVQEVAPGFTPIQVTNKPTHSMIAREFGEAHQIAEDVSIRFDPDTGIVEFTGEGAYNFLETQLGRVGRNFHITELNRNLLFQVQMLLGWPLRGEQESLQPPSTYRSLLFVVPIIRQPAPWGCWAASFAMLYTWRHPDEVQIPDPNIVWPDEENTFLRNILRPYGERWVDSFDREVPLTDANVSSFLNDTGLSGEMISNPRSPDQWFRLLSIYGPLMVGIAGHMLVVAGIAGNGIPEETVFFVNNPSYGGEETTEPFNDFIDRFEALEAAGHEGVHVFHWP